VQPIVETVLFYTWNDSHVIMSTTLHAPPCWRSTVLQQCKVANLETVVC